MRAAARCTRQYATVDPDPSGTTSVRLQPSCDNVQYTIAFNIPSTMLFVVASQQCNRTVSERYHFATRLSRRASFASALFEMLSETASSARPSSSRFRYRSCHRSMPVGAVGRQSGRLTQHCSEEPLDQRFTRRASRSAATRTTSSVRLSILTDVWAWTISSSWPACAAGAMFWTNG